MDALCISIFPRGTSNRRTSGTEAAEACYHFGLPLDSLYAGLSRVDYL